MRCSNALTGKEIFLLSKSSRPGLKPTQPFIQCVRGLFTEGRGAQWSERDVDHILSTAELKNEWSYTAVPPVCRRGMKRDSSGCSAVLNRVDV